MVTTRSQEAKKKKSTNNVAKETMDSKGEHGACTVEAKPTVSHPNLSNTTEKLINTILSNNLTKVPKFSGKTSENVIKWINDVNNELNLLKLDDSQKFSVVQTFLLDDARRWFINNLTTLHDWNIFIEQIEKAFSSPLHQEMAIKTVGTRQQGINETVLHYYNDMVELFDLIDNDMPEEYKVSYLKTGLKVSIKKEVMRRNPKSARELLEIAQAEEKLDSTLTVSMDSNDSMNAEYLSAMNSSGKNFTRQTYQQTTQSRHRTRCYQCHRIGHYARDCFTKNY